MAMDRRSTGFLIAALLASGLAWAEARAILPMPDGTLYVSECGSCHTAYAPGFLPARSWRQLMDGLGRHFGDDASLSAAERALILAQLEALATDTPNADPEIAARNRAIPAQAVPLRITETPFFRFMHDEVPGSIWQRPKISRKANCGACHTRADEGRYPEAEVRIPR